MKVIKTLKALVAGSALAIAAASSQAHIVGIGWSFEGNGDITFDALHWHGSHGAAGALKIDGVAYAFTSATHNVTSMTGLDGGLANASYSTYAAGTLTATSGPNDWLHVTVSGLSVGAHTLSADYGPGGLTSWTLNGGVTSVGIVTPPSTASEPGSLALLALGLAGIGFTRRRKTA